MIVPPTATLVGRDLVRHISQLGSRVRSVSLGLHGFYMLHTICKRFASLNYAASKRLGCSNTAHDQHAHNAWYHRVLRGF